MNETARRRPAKIKLNIRSRFALLLLVVEPFKTISKQEKIWFLCRIFVRIPVLEK